jgi:hypothetical protein
VKTSELGGKWLKLEEVIEKKVWMREKPVSGGWMSF